MDQLLLREFQELDYDSAENNGILNEQERQLKKDGYYILSGILQSANKRNGNGRIYSRKILEREMENYQKAIKERRAVGECVEEGSEILTLGGWKDFRELFSGEYVYTLNQETNQIELQKIEEKIDREHNNEVYHFQGRSIDIKVTPGHKFLLVNRYGKKIVATAQEIFQNRKKYDKCYIPKRGEWNPPEDKQEFVISGVSAKPHTTKEYREKQKKELKIPMKTWAQFMGIFLSDGCASDGCSGHSVYLYQNEGWKAERIREMLKNFPDEIKWAECTRLNEGSEKANVIFHANDQRLYEYLNKLGKSYQKYIPRELKLLSAPILSEIIEWFHMGDGRVRTTDKGIEKKERAAKEVFSTSKRLIDDLQEILLKSGGCGNTLVYKQRDSHIKGRLISKENCRDMNFLHLSTARGIYLDQRFMKITKEEYSGRVYCVRVPNHTFYCRNKGKAFWSHNCDHADSYEVNLKNASHLILRTFWQGDDVCGVIKVLKNTPSGKILEGLLKDGVQLGISSRALGSLKETPQGAMVQEDLQLICFDIVNEPSTPNAYLIPESKKKQMFSKADRINRLLNDIVGNK